MSDAIERLKALSQVTGALTLRGKDLTDLVDEIAAIEKEVVALRKILRESKGRVVDL
jgi:hypothetical protein